VRRHAYRGAALELSGQALAGRAGINGVIFGATVLAAATALPEISSGFAAVKLDDTRSRWEASSAGPPSRCACPWSRI